MENASLYTHKKFAVSKRKREDLDRDEESLSQQQSEYCQISKRRQTQGFFRPWLDNEQSSSQEVRNTCSSPRPTTPLVSQYHANMVRRPQSPRQRSPKEQERRDRNTLACLLSRRAKQAQEERMAREYEHFRNRHAAMLEQQMRLGLYYRQLLQQAVFQRAIAPAPGHLLPQQQQQFLQQMSLSQQMLIFGSQQ
ncbi:hypothetical protein KR018_002005 [Drosophila ironensis]|nr:hypothetical protein KR018_002005 [Drosophila ironensis]